MWWLYDVHVSGHHIGRTTWPQPNCPLSNGKFQLKDHHKLPVRLFNHPVHKIHNIFLRGNQIGKRHTSECVQETPFRFSRGNPKRITWKIVSTIFRLAFSEVNSTNTCWLDLFSGNKESFVLRCFCWLIRYGISTKNQFCLSHSK